MRGLKTVALGAGAVALLAGCSTGGVSDLAATSATVHGTVETRDAAASYLFQYGTSGGALGTDAGQTTPRRQLAANTASKEVTEALTGLTPTTTYSYRLCGRIAGAEADSCLATRRFTTPAAGSKSITFDEPGIHEFVVPAGVTKLSALVAGAGGGAGYFPTYFANTDPVPAPGGKGASIQGRLPDIAPGKKLTIRVGGAGTDVFAIGAIFPGAGGKGGSNGLDRGGNGGSGNGFKGPLDSSIGDLTFPYLGSGGGGGGAPSVIFQTTDGIPELGYPPSDTETMIAGGGGGGGGGSMEQSLPARGGDAGENGRFGTDGARTDAEEPRSLGGQGGQSRGSYSMPIAGQGGRGGGRDADGRNGGDGGTDTTASPTPSCGISDMDFRQGGGGGGGGAAGGGGGGTGRLHVTAYAGPDFCGINAETVYDGASGGGGGASQANTLDYSDLGAPAPIITPAANTGDGFVTLTWTVPAGD